MKQFIVFAAALLAFAGCDTRPVEVEKRIEQGVTIIEVKAIVDEVMVENITVTPADCLTSQYEKKTLRFSNSIVLQSIGCNVIGVQVVTDTDTYDFLF